MKNSIRYAVFSIALVVLASMVLFRWSHASGARTASPPEAQPTELSLPTATPAPTLNPSITPIPSPSPTPENKTSMTLAVAGDLVIHSGINSEAETDSGYDYIPLLADAIPYVDGADYAVCTLETTLSPSGIYSGYPTFISPAELAASLYAVGFDLVNTASEHCADGGVTGLCETMDIIEEAGMTALGTFRNISEKNADSGVRIAEVNGIRLAFISFVYGTEQSVDSFRYALNLYKTTDGEINYSAIDRALSAAKDLEADATVVMMHWGNEYYTEPVQEQEELADYIFTHGADIILGGHCLMPQPMETRQVADADGNTRTCFLVYCVGNLLSCLTDQYTNLTSIITIGIEKDHNAGSTVITGVEYVPMLQIDLTNYTEESEWRYRLLDIYACIDAWESGDNRGFMTENIYDDLVTALNDLHSIVGTAFDVRETEIPQ